MVDGGVGPRAAPTLAGFTVGLALSGLATAVLSPASEDRSLPSIPRLQNRTHVAL